MRERLQHEGGFGLVELLIAMVILTVGLMGLVAAFNSSAITLRRASTVSTAAVLADQQMERYRAMKYTAITLDSSSITAAQADSHYTGDSAYSATMVSGYCDPPVPDECNASRAAVGPDGRNYRVDTYIVTQLVRQVNADGTESDVTTSRTLKRVTVVVRDGGTPSRVYVRTSSTFDQATGS